MVVVTTSALPVAVEPGAPRAARLTGVVDPETPLTRSSVEWQWLSLPEVAERLDLELREVRGMLSEQHLLAVRRPPRSAWSVPSTFLIQPAGAQAARPVPGLRGTLIQLADSGLDPQESVTWLHTPHEELGQAPITSLRSGVVHTVRRAAQALAW